MSVGGITLKRALSRDAVSYTATLLWFNNALYLYLITNRISQTTISLPLGVATERRTRFFV